MILIVDDDMAIRRSVALLLSRKGHNVAEASSPDEASAMLRDTPFELMIMDMNYSISATGGEEGIHLLRRAGILRPEMPVILITAWGSIELAVEGMRHGAFDFITKPWDNRVLLQRVEMALSLHRSGDNCGDACDFNACGFIGRDPAVVSLLATVKRVAPTDAPVLILGENGTGKELIAKALHVNSRRAGGPFVMVNLGGISTTLFESEMFGHARGAFTGAATERVGRFELADKGTIFLDEIGDLGADCQVKLLRVLQQHTFERLGESRPRTTDFRPVCATNADLAEMVRERTFREDLFYRINLITLRIPPLRERRGDIPLLVRHFVAEACGEGNMPLLEADREAIDYLVALPWPGNVRQLKNTVHRAVLMHSGAILTKADFELSEKIDSPDRVMTPAGATLDEIEKEAVAGALARCGGNLSRAAASLGITRQSLYRKMEKHGLNTLR